ncbi:MAG: DUF2793 domain-containing protein [Hyphomicrobiales bacterium]|jgi:hypothetical protein
MDTSARFSLPLIIASQAQKHLTHNEALAQLETLVQPVVQDIAALAPPSEPSEADCLVIGTGAGDVFAGKDNAIAAWIAEAWHFHVPEAGWMVVRASDGVAFVFDGTAWGPLVDLAVQDNLVQVGINAAASTTNRLTVASDASLFTSASNDHRMTINKANAGSTASMVFQSGWSGRAEMGLAGQDGFSIKVSADGSAWHDALAITPNTGHVRLPARPVGSFYLDGGTRNFGSGDVAGFSGVTRSQGGLALGAALASPASGTELLVPADGLYQFTLTLKVETLGGLTLLKNGVDAMAAWEAGLTSVGGRTVTFSTVIDLYTGDSLALRFEAPAICYCYSGTTFVDVVSL